MQLLCEFSKLGITPSVTIDTLVIIVLLPLMLFEFRDEHAVVFILDQNSGEPILCFEAFSGY